MTPRPKRRAMALSISMVVVGSIATYNMWLPRDQRVGPDWSRGAFVLVGPILLAWGAVHSMLGLAARRRTSPAKATTADTSSRWVLRAGVTLLLVGGFPWAYTPFLCGFNNEEASGMLGTIIFLLVGLPGIAVTGIGISLRNGHRRKSSGGLVASGR